MSYTTKAHSHTLPHHTTLVLKPQVCTPITSHNVPPQLAIPYRIIPHGFSNHKHTTTPYHVIPDYTLPHHHTTQILKPQAHNHTIPHTVRTYLLWVDDVHDLSECPCVVGRNCATRRREHLQLKSLQATERMITDTLVPHDRHTEATLGTAAWKTKSERGERLEFEALSVMDTLEGSAGLGRWNENTIFRPFFSKAVISGMPTCESVEVKDTLSHPLSVADS